MTIEEEIKRFTDNAEYERTNGNLQGCMDFRQLAEWLKDYKRLKEQEPKKGKRIDVRPIVRGKWIAEYDKLDGHFRTYHCSNCENLQGYTSNFCEECGSENREVEE